jgi:hypothetical protein
MTSRTYPAGQPVNVAVHFPTCLSHNCSVDRKTSCSAAFEAGSDQRLVVDSFGSFEEKTQSACATDCGNLIARCSTPPLAAGTYVFEHGGASVTLTVPFSGPPPCVNAQGP